MRRALSMPQYVKSASIGVEKWRSRRRDKNFHRRCIAPFELNKRREIVRPWRLFVKGGVAKPHLYELQPRNDFSSGEVVYPTVTLIVRTRAAFAPALAMRGTVHRE